ncbi:hypothetical protein [Paenibacillus chibensis]
MEGGLSRRADEMQLIAKEVGFSETYTYVQNTSFVIKYKGKSKDSAQTV